MSAGAVVRAAAQRTTQEVGGLTGWVLDVIERLGAVGLGMLTVLETLFPPLPSEVFLPAGGYVASQGHMSVAAAWIAATIGSLLAAWLLFGVGRRIGADRINGVVARVPLVEAEDVGQAHAWFERHGRSSVLIGRLVPGVRSFVSIPAGTSSMSVLAFSVLTFVGSGIWNALLVGAGWYLGKQWKNVEAWSTWFDVAILAAFLLAVGRFVWKRRQRFASDESARHA